MPKTVSKITSLIKASKTVPPALQRSGTHPEHSIHHSGSFILVVGHCGSFNQEFVASVRLTRHYQSNSSSRGLEFVATDGVDSLAKSDVDVFTEVAEDVLRRKDANQRISGLIIIYPAADQIDSRAIQQNLKGLTNLFLGGDNLNRLTILVVSTKQNKASKNIKLLVQQMQLSSEDKILHYKTELESASRLLNQHNADQLQIQAARQKPEEELDYYRTENRRLTDQLQANQSQANQHIQNLEARISRLDQQLEQTRSEYASLRLQVQLHNNYEQGEISQDLKSINNMIERLGQSMSEYLVDRHVETAFRKHPDDATTLDARDLPVLKSAFGHQEGRPSLVTSASGDGLGVENFIDFSIRAQICHLLVKTIFRPFHPFIDPAESAKYTATYEQVRRKEPQFTAGKWRSITFKNIYLPPKLHKPTSEQIEALAVDMLSHILRPLARCLFGWATKKLAVQEVHYSDLKDLIARAWEWSSKVKEEVIMLGDFQPTALDIQNGSAVFDSRKMEDFEPNARGTRPRFALCALGLGLISS
ncbi:unnamed protein product [Rhizoctonia solani]|uniref:Uncharacterized protein n=1 Tax=Rhizoctonia solani TaxID=456999 RepID=A0A8H3BDP4_9AGAM|nr:unnamed protein product [Rhizoctonia solani]